MHSRVQLGQSLNLVVTTVLLALLLDAWHVEMLSSHGYRDLPFIAYSMYAIALAVMVPLWTLLVLEAVAGSYMIFAGPAGVSVVHRWFGRRVGESTLVAGRIRSVSGGQIPGAFVYAKAVLFQIGASESIPLMAQAGLRTSTAVQIAAEIQAALGLSGARGSAEPALPADNTPPEL